MRWKPLKAELKEWLERKEDEFMEEETRGLSISPQYWKDRYLYSDIHRIFFFEFPILVQEWVKRKTEINTM